MLLLLLAYVLLGAGGHETSQQAVTAMGPAVHGVLATIVNWMQLIYYSLLGLLGTMVMLWLCYAMDILPQRWVQQRFLAPVRQAAARFQRALKPDEGEGDQATAEREDRATPEAGPRP
ncbi:hypothetical protein [Azospirillum sp. B4]|uniref:hypothetical protein n=1 Tax=Azospirillum sp. B4 TaxID=95605 RepID=UPI0011DE2407|nr:hypothetical protein [Azospirillum sp. B4]